VPVVGVVAVVVAVAVDAIGMRMLPAFQQALVTVAISAMMRSTPRGICLTTQPARRLRRRRRPAQPHLRRLILQWHRPQLSLANRF